MIIPSIPKPKNQTKISKTDPEQDRTSIYSGSDDGVLMTLIQLCTKVVRNRDTKIADENDKLKEKDYKRYTVDVNFKYGAKSVMSHKDICTEANKSVNTKSIIDGFNTTCFAYEIIRYIEKIQMHNTNEA